MPRPYPTEEINARGKSVIGALRATIKNADLEPADEPVRIKLR